MKDPEAPGPPGRLVLLACGNDATVAAVVAPPAAALAAVDRPALRALPRDPGHPLADGGCWAEALAAWRLPALLLIPAPQLASGSAAAGTALLRQCRVPLVGLLQLGGPWQPGPRRLDGLPWLGCLAADAGAADAEAGAAADLAPLIARRFRAVETEAGGPWH
ncbi:MAG: hypothetical protein ACKOPN_09870 [Prochlorococcaceae cyanobacterium]